MKDKFGVELYMGATVLVPDPDDRYYDMHSHSFIGGIKTFDGFTTVVEDGDGDCFEIENFRLEIVEDND